MNLLRKGRMVGNGLGFDIVYMIVGVVVVQKLSTDWDCLR